VGADPEREMRKSIAQPIASSSYKPHSWAAFARRNEILATIASLQAEHVGGLGFEFCPAGAAGAAQRQRPP